MTTKKQRIVRYTSEELNEMRACGQAGSDWDRAARISPPDDSDPDDAVEPVRMDWIRTELPVRRPKAHASLRIDADVLAWFRAQGSGYQTKINAILRSYYEQHTR
jgi:uncharacterized protein (DUF4415 family)